MKKGDTVRVIESGYNYPNYEYMAKTLKATKWRKNTKVSNGSIGVIKKSHWRAQEEKRYFLVEIGTKELVFTHRGLEVVPKGTIKTRKKIIKKKKVVKRKARTKPSMFFTAGVFNILSRALKKRLRSSHAAGEDSQPFTFVLGKNSNDVVTRAIAVNKHTKYYGGCYRMASVNSSEMAKALMSIYQAKAIPCGVARVGRFRLSDKSSSRGNSLNEVSKMGGFILSMTKEGTKIEFYKDDYSRRCSELQMKVVMSASKIKKGREVKKNGKN